MYGQYSVHVVQIQFEYQIFIAIVYIYLTQRRSIRYYCSSNWNLFSSIGKLHILWCMDNIQSTFTNTFWISNFHWYCVYIIHFNEDLSDISAAPTQSF